MILNELLAKQNILNALLLKNSEDELSKELKVKIVRLRIEYNKIKKQFDEDIKNFTETLIPEELKNLQSKNPEELTEEEQIKMQELVSKVNAEYSEFLMQKGEETVDFNKNDKFTEQEFDEIIGINAGNEVTINNIQLKAEDLMDTFNSLFVEN